MIDVQRLRSTVDAHAVIGRYVELRRVGREHAGPCLWCPCQASGRSHRCDRFRLFEDGQWWCRRCKAHGDVIDFVRRVERLEFVAACEFLGGSTGRDTVLRTAPKVAVVEQEAFPPAPDWQAAALQVVEQCELALWAKVGASARAYLHRERLLTDETIRRFRLGYSERDQQVAGLFVKAGITIPHLGPQGEVWHVNVRRSPRAEGSKYQAIAGGSVLAFGLAQQLHRADVALTEGEFDAMLLSQECPDLDVFTLGGASRRVAPLALLPRLAFARRVLLLHDGDGDGQAAAQELAERYAGVVVDLPTGLDVTDVARTGASLRELVAPNAEGTAGSCVYCGGDLFTYRVDGLGLCAAHDAREVAARSSSHMVDELLSAGALLEAA